MVAAQVMKKESRRLLVVDPDPGMRDLGAGLSTSSDFQVHFAESGEAGLTQARALSPAMVVTEVLLPDIDGFALCRALKGEIQPPPCVLVVSVVAALERALEAGADAFLRKPVGAAELLDIVRRVLDGGRT